MNLVIHDLNDEKWEAIRPEYAGWNVVSDQGTIRPCVGCFRCWNKNPGECAIKDGYENMGALIHHAGEVVVISRYTYGGFSGFVKNVFDRCLSYVLPQFEVIDGETHHQKRYEEDKPFTFIFYGQDLSDEQKASARRYVKAVCANIRGHVENVIFRENIGESVGKCDSTPKASESTSSSSTGGTPAASDNEVSAPLTDKENTSEIHPGKILLLNGSMRTEHGNSAKFARKLAGLLTKDSEIVELRRYRNKPEELLAILKSAPAIVFCVPLYVDGLPSQVIRFMEQAEREYQGEAKKVYVLANMGLYESKQLENLFEAVRQWSDKMSFEYCGGLGLSAGELIGGLMDIVPFRGGVMKTIVEGMQRLAKAVDIGGKIEDIYAEPHHFPRSLYIFIANTNWNRTSKKNGIRPKDMYRQL